MSKQGTAKEHQQYVPKAIPQVCSNCKNCMPVLGRVLRYVDIHKPSLGTNYVTSQISQQCGIGKFAVKKMGTCSLWIGAPEKDTK